MTTPFSQHEGNLGGPISKIPGSQPSIGLSTLERYFLQTPLWIYQFQSEKRALGGVRVYPGHNDGRGRFRDDFGTISGRFWDDLAIGIHCGLRKREGFGRALFAAKSRKTWHRARKRAKSASIRHLKSPDPRRHPACPV